MGAALRARGVPSRQRCSLGREWATFRMPEDFALRKGGKRERCARAWPSSRSAACPREVLRRGDLGRTASARLITRRQYAG